MRRDCSRHTAPHSMPLRESSNPLVGFSSLLLTNKAQFSLSLYFVDAEGLFASHSPTLDAAQRKFEPCRSSDLTLLNNNASLFPDFVIRGCGGIVRVTQPHTRCRSEKVRTLLSGSHPSF